MKKSRAERIYQNKKVKERIKSIKPYGYLFIKYQIKDKNGKEFITESGNVMTSKKFYKRISNKIIRNYSKNQILKDFENVDNLKSSEMKKLFDYYWTLY